jgi:hypothetical protein
VESVPIWLDSQFSGNNRNTGGGNLEHQKQRAQLDRANWPSRNSSSTNVDTAPSLPYCLLKIPVTWGIHRIFCLRKAGPPHSVGTRDSGRACERAQVTGRSGSPQSEKKRHEQFGMSFGNTVHFYSR